MKKLFLLSTLAIAVSAIGFTACKIYVNESDSGNSSSTEAVSQTLTSKMLDVTAVSKIEVSGVVNVVYVQDSEVSAEMVAPDNLLDKYSYKNVNGKLKVWKGDGKENIKGKQQSLKLIVHSPALKSVSLSGVSSFVAKSLTGGLSDIKFDMSGVSNVSIADMTCDNVSVDASGVSVFKVAGISAGNIDIDCSGSSNVEMNIADAKMVDVDCSGASTVTLAGKAQKVAYDCSGASSIKAAGLEAQTGTSHSSGVSSIKSNIKNNK